MSGPPLSGESPAQAAGSSVTGSSRPQALIQRRQRLTYELRLSRPVIVSRPAPQPPAGDSAVAQPTTTPFTGLVRAPEPIGDMPPRRIPRPTSLCALRCVPSGVVVRVWLPEPCPAATGGSGFTIETGSKSGFSRTFDDPRPPTSSIILIFQGMLVRSEPERHALHRECGRTQIRDRYHGLSCGGERGRIAPKRYRKRSVCAQHATHR